MPTPVRIAIVNDYAIVVAGVRALLAPYADRIEIVELDSKMPVVSDVDVILYDNFSSAQGTQTDVESLTLGAGSARVVVYSWNLQPEVVDPTLAAGVAGYVSKALGAPELVAAIEKVAAGGSVRPTETGVADLREGEGDWPGRAEGLTAREAEIIALITQGLSNQEIAERCFLSINSIKTYIRTAYRRMGVTSRSQAVLWGVRHGFNPDVVRYQLER